MRTTRQQSTETASPARPAFQGQRHGGRLALLLMVTALLIGGTLAAARRGRVVRRPARARPRSRERSGGDKPRHVCRCNRAGRDHGPHAHG